MIIEMIIIYRITGKELREEEKEFHQEEAEVGSTVMSHMVVVVGSDMTIRCNSVFLWLANTFMVFERKLPTSTHL